MPVIDLGRVIGPQGPQGAQGAQGQRGEQGFPGPNIVGGDTATTLTGVLVGNGNVVGTRAIDAAPTEDSTGFATSGGTDKAIKGRVPVYGRGVNLLRNWYFAGGGTGRGVFPVNQRGITSGTFDTNYKINGWKFNYNGTAGTFSFGATGMTITVPASSTARIAQYIDDVGKLSGKQITASVVFADGTYDVGTITRAAGTLQSIGAYTRFLTSDVFELTVYNTTKVFVAAQLEFGSEQTLFHLENGSPVLNYIPDYEEELIKCQTSTADSTDTFANKTPATEQEICITQNGPTTSQSFSVNSYFLMNGLLYCVTSPISNGGTISPGSNCESSNVMEEFRGVSIANKVTPETGTSINRAIRIGNLVIMHLTTPKVTTANQEVTIATMAEGYRPKSGLNYSGCLRSNTNSDFGYGFVGIGSNGQISMMYNKTTTYGLSATLIYYIN